MRPVRAPKLFVPLLNVFEGKSLSDLPSILVCKTGLAFSRERCEDYRSVRSMCIKTLARECAAAGIVASSLAFSGTLLGGEAIQFSSDKVKPVAASENPLTKDRLTPKSKLSATSPLDGADAGMMRSESGRRLDPKEARRQDNKKLEDENWMILNEGDL